MNTNLSARTPLVRIVWFFGHTGNFVAHSESEDLLQVTDQFKNLLNTHWILRLKEDLRAELEHIKNFSRPADDDFVRWTPGLAIQSFTGGTAGTLESTPRAVLSRISPYTVVVFKRDTITRDKDIRFS